MERTEQSHRSLLQKLTDQPGAGLPMLDDRQCGVHVQSSFMTSTRSGRRSKSSPVKQLHCIPVISEVGVRHEVCATCRCVGRHDCSSWEYKVPPPTCLCPPPSTASVLTSFERPPIMVLTSTTALLAASLSLSSVVDCLPSFGHSKQSHYPGWAGIKHIFTLYEMQSEQSEIRLTPVSGDSYTTTGFNESLAQPSQANPLGNPAYP